MKDRIKSLRKELGLTQTEFGKRIGLSRDGIASYERGLANPPQSTVLMMVHEFNVNEEWLRNGIGEMFLETSVEDEITRFAGSVCNLSSDDPRYRIMKMLAQLPQEDWKAVTDMIDLLQDTKKEPSANADSSDSSGNV